MFLQSKKYVILGVVCMLASAAYAQHKTVIIKYLNPKNDVHKTLQNMTRVPSKYAQVNELTEIRQSNFQNAVLDGINMGLERQAIKAAQAQRQAVRAAQKVAAPKVKEGFYHPTELSHEQLQANAQKATQFIADYLAANENVWPVYAPHSQENNLLKRISNFMEVENPSVEVVYIQQEIIRLRAQSQARGPKEVLSIVQDMIAYGLIPSRAYISEEGKYTDDEVSIGEELAFALAAYKVPMENNPWKLEGMAEVADKASTYYAMRRADPLFEGLPHSHIQDGIHQPNFPVWTRAQFVQHQRLWVEEHPFEYALADYWEKTFGHAFYKVYNVLSPLEKEAILFSAPDLPQVADATAVGFSAHYDKALERWIAEHKRAPFSRVGMDKEEYFGKVLADPATYPLTVGFQNSQRQWVDFADLHYPEQLEVLLWIWQKYQILPQKALQIIGKTSAHYY